MLAIIAFIFTWFLWMIFLGILMSPIALMPGGVTGIMIVAIPFALHAMLWGFPKKFPGEDRSRAGVDSIAVWLLSSMIIGPIMVIIGKWLICEVGCTVALVIGLPIAVATYAYYYGVDKLRRGDEAFKPRSVKEDDW